MSKPPRLCSLCGKVHPTDILCQRQREQARARKQRFDRTRPSATERGYDSRWRKARLEFLAVRPWCFTKGCGAAATVVDHIIPHRGDQKLFWDRSNWQPLCARCHSRHKQRLERMAAL